MDFSILTQKMFESLNQMNQTLATISEQLRENTAVTSQHLTALLAKVNDLNYRFDVSFVKQAQTKPRRRAVNETELRLPSNITAEDADRRMALEKYVTQYDPSICADVRDIDTMSVVSHAPSTVAEIVPEPQQLQPQQLQPQQLQQYYYAQPGVYQMMPQETAPVTIPPQPKRRGRPPKS